MRREWIHDSQRDTMLISQALGREPCRAGSREVRWDSENSPRRYVYYPAKGIVYDTKNPPATSVWTFLESRGWSRDQLKEAFGLARGDLLRLAAAPARRQRPAREPFRPAADRKDANLRRWQERWIRRAARAPRVPYSSPGWMWACALAGDKHGAWPPRRRFPAPVRWIAGGGRRDPGVAGHIAVMLYPIEAWQDAWSRGYGRPPSRRCLAVHLLAVGHRGERVENRHGWHKRTFGAKRGCVLALGFARPGRAAWVVEGLADALAVHQHLPEGVVTVSSCGTDIAGASHDATHRWLADRSMACLAADPEPAGVAAWSQLERRILDMGGTAIIDAGANPPATGDPWDRYRRRPGRCRASRGM